MMTSPMTVRFFTLGCKLNQAETESLADAVLSAGGRILTGDGEPDMVIVNSCTVTSKSDQKTRRQARWFAKKYPRALVILTGCYAEVEFESLSRLFAPDGQIAVVPQHQKPFLHEFALDLNARDDFGLFSPAEKRALLEAFLKNKPMTDADPFRLSGAESVFHARAFLKIEDGCDNRCAYCRVPLARGNAVSLDAGKVFEKVEQFVDRGFYEIVLTGVNISTYRSGPYDLAALLEHTVRQTRNLRFRLSSLEPEAWSSRLFDALAAEAVCPHFHLPIQSGSNHILARMRRRYRIEKVHETVDRLRSLRPDAFITADIIVGFPGETEACFAETERAVRDLTLNRLHVFPFSKRPGTEAFLMEKFVPDATIRRRVESLLAVSDDSFHRYLQGFRGREVDVILERQAGTDAYTGSSAQSVKCLVTGIPEPSMKKRLRVRARIIRPAALSGAVFTSQWGGEPEFQALDKITADTR